MKENSKTLFSIYRDTFNDIFPVRSPAWSIKDASLLKKLIEEQGYQESVDYITSTMENWEMIKKAVRTMNGYPTVGVLWSFRFTFLNVVKEGFVRSNSVEYGKKKKAVQLKSKSNKRVSSKSLFLQS
jgi:hypothetical protein